MLLEDTPYRYPAISTHKATAMRGLGWSAAEQVGGTRSKQAAEPGPMLLDLEEPSSSCRSHTCFEGRLTGSTETVSGRLPVRQRGKRCSSPDTARTSLWMLKIVCLSRLKFVGPGAGSQLHRESFSMIHRPPGCRGPILMQGRFGHQNEEHAEHSAPGCGAGAGASDFPRVLLPDSALPATRCPG